MIRKQPLSAMLWSTLALAAGCSQVLGLGDYETVDQSGAVGGEGGELTAGGGEAGEAGSGGASPVGGSGESGGSGTIGGEGGAGGEGGGEPVTVIPCDSLDCCKKEGGTAVGTELLSDGGFEQGLIDDGNSPWTEESTLEFSVISITDDPEVGFSSKSGDYYAYLSGVQTERSSIYSEDLQIPNDAGWLTLSGYRLFQIDVQDDTNKDFCLIALYDPMKDDPQELPFWWGAPKEHPDGWGDTPVWKKFEASFDAAPHQGATRYLGLRGESDTYPERPAEPDPEVTYSSSFLFDDVSLKAFKCVK